MSRHLTLTLAALLGCFVLGLSLGFPPVQAANSVPDANAPTGRGVAQDAQLAARVEALSAMPAEQRQAELRQLSPEERRGLWFQLKRMQADKRGIKAPVRGSGMKAQPRSGKAKPPNKAVGSIVYDDGVIGTSFGGGAIIGNRFNTASGNALLASGTISTVVGVMVPGPLISSSSAGFVIEGPQTVGGGAFAIFSSFTAGLTAATETVVFTGIGANYTGSSFFVLFGDFASVYVPAFGTGSTMGQGFHGVVGYTGGMGPDITNTFDFGGTRNGLVRVTGNVLPVELMSFEVE